MLNGGKTNTNGSKKDLSGYLTDSKGEIFM